MLDRPALLFVVILAVVCVLTPARTTHAGGRRSRPVKTGQTTCWDATGAVVACAGTSQDGELRRGEPRSYADNGDGTIRDKRTALTWEKLSNDDSIHDKDNTYSWADAFLKIDDLNTAAFAGFTDWRLPNQSELETIVDRSKFLPSVPTEFQHDCTAGCTVLTCSCTVAPFDEIAWSSTTYVKTPSAAWLVNFYDGTAYSEAKSALHHVRAVRGGS